MFKKDKKKKEEARAVDVSSNKQVEHTPRKCFRCGSEDHMIAKCPEQVCFNKKLIMHATTAKMIVTVRYMHIWHEYLATTIGKIMVRLNIETEHLYKKGDRVQDILWNKSSV